MTNGGVQTGQTTSPGAITDFNVSESGGVIEVDYTVQNQSPYAESPGIEVKIGNVTSPQDHGQLGSGEEASGSYSRDPNTSNLPGVDWSISTNSDHVSGTITLSPSVNITNVSEGESTIDVTVSHKNVSRVDVNIWDGATSVAENSQSYSHTGSDTTTFSLDTPSPGSYTLQANGVANTTSTSDEMGLTVEQMTSSVSISGTSTTSNSVTVGVSWDQSSEVEVSLMEGGSTLDTEAMGISSSSGSGSVTFEGVEPGSYTVEVDAFSPGGTSTDSSTVTVELEEVPPTATITDLSLEDGGVIPQVDVEMGVPDNGVRNYYLLKDGEVIQSWEDTFLPPVIIPDEQGDYTVELEVVNDAGLADTDSETFTVEFQPPSASIESLGKDGNTIRPSGAVQPGDGEITQVRWIVSYPEPGEQDEHIGDDPEFVIEDPGDYTLLMEATDENELIGADEMEFTISDEGGDGGPDNGDGGEGEEGSGFLNTRTAIGATAGLGGLVMMMSDENGDK